MFSKLKKPVYIAT